MSWFDTHCHLQSFHKKGELESVLQRADEAGVSRMVTVGTSPEDWADYLELSIKYCGKIDYSVGLHPGYVDANWADHISSLPTFWESNKSPVALGEIGLDYFRLPKEPELAEQIINWQKEALRRQLLWARQFDCPIIIHSRAAFDDCVEEIDRSGVNWERVVFHCFTEGVAQIKKLIERGGRASFTGILTFPKNDQLWEAVKYQGVEKLMLETDSPYLAPVPHRGKRNEPAFINKVGEYACNLLNVDAVDKIWANSMNFYQLHV